MRAFVAALVLFALMLLLIVGNLLYVRRITNELETRLSDLAQSGDEQEAQALLDTWKNARRSLRFSVPKDDLAEIDDRFTELCVTASKKDADELTLAVRLSLNAVKRLWYNEQPFCH